MVFGLKVPSVISIKIFALTAGQVETGAGRRREREKEGKDAGKVHGNEG